MYKRILLKLSGEALKDSNNQNILDPEKLNHFAQVIKTLHENNIDICVVIGAGNIWRGKLAQDIGLDRVQGDYSGMLGTVINAISLSSSLSNCGVESIVTSALPAIKGVTVDYSIEVCEQAFKENKVVFLSGGTGLPYFTTDTAATKRAVELDCEAILVGKNGVEGVYDDDPNKNKDAHFIKEITFNEMLKQHLQIMDLTAIELIKEKNIEIRIFSMDDPDNFLRVAKGEDLGTICHKGE